MLPVTTSGTTSEACVYHPRYAVAMVERSWWAQHVMLCYSTLSTLPTGGPGRWRVISLCAGGRHSMVLAVPDGSSVDRDADAASSARSSPQLRPLSSNGHAQGAAPPSAC